MNQDDPFALRNNVPSVSWRDAPVGSRKTLRVLQDPEVAQSRDFDTGEPARYPDGNPKMSVVTRVQDLDTNEERALWVKMPSAMLSAIGEAQVRAGSRVRVGGILEITYIGEEQTDATGRKNPTKKYAAVYTPPDAFGATSQSASGPPSWATGGAPPPPSTWMPPVAPPNPAPTYPAPAPAYVAPAAAQTAPAAGPAPTVGPSPEQIAAVRAAGLDPAVIFGQAVS